MKTTIIIILASILLMYLQKARIHYSNTFRAAAQRYGPKTAKRTRKGFALRAVLWIVPHRFYHWKQVLWARKVDKLLNNDEKGTDNEDR
jgi:hypothetical protein